MHLSLLVTCTLYLNVAFLSNTYFHLFIQCELMTFRMEKSTFDFGFDLVHSFSKLLLEVEGLESLLVVVDAGSRQNRQQNCERTEILKYLSRVTRKCASRKRYISLDISDYLIELLNRLAA